jgi:hypothetical protein
MKKFPLLILIAIVVVIGLGAFLLTRWDIPAQSKQTEKVLPDDMFPK